MCEFLYKNTVYKLEKKFYLLKAQSLTLNISKLLERLLIVMPWYFGQQLYNVLRWRIGFGLVLRGLNCSKSSVRAQLLYL